MLSTQNTDSVPVDIVQHLVMCLCSFADVTVSVFGSSASGFALRTSDINLNINLSGSTEKLVLHTVPSALEML